MTPIDFVSINRRDKEAAGGNIDLKLECVYTMIKNINLEGDVTLRGTWDKPEIIMNCRAFDDKPWKANITNNNDINVVVRLRSYSINHKRKI